MARRSVAISAVLVALAVAGAAGGCGEDATTPEGGGTSGVPTSPGSPAAEGGAPAGTIASGAPCAVVTTASSECASGICAAPDGSLSPPPARAAPVDDASASELDGGDAGDAGGSPAGFCTVGCGPPGNPSLDCNGAAFTGICSGTGVCQVRAL